MVVVGRGRSNLRAAWTAGRLAARRMFGRANDERDAVLGEALTHQLDEMKGLAMKLGQIVSYMDVPLPAAVTEKLARLQTGEHGMSAEDTRAVLDSALGADFETRLDAIDWSPIAAASIGQVHRARYEGREIALKVRYPEVAESFRSDLSAVGRVASLAGLASAVDGRAIVGELQARLVEECDYRTEARSQAMFRAAFATDAGLEIPEVFEALSTESTLATAWSEGIPFAEALERPQAVRNRYAEALVRFSYRSLLELGVIQADPHPGNFLFHDDGRVVCLDFGCVRRLEPHFVGYLRQMLEAIEAEDRASFRGATIGLGMAPRPERFDFDHHFETMAHLHRPLLEPGFVFSSDFIRKGMEFNGPTSPNARVMNMPPAYVWVARLQWGLWSLLNRLRSTADLRPILDAILTTESHAACADG